MTKETRYLHGYSPVEQQRLIAQAQTLEEAVFAELDYRGKKSLLELGCGVGAQTRLLLDHFKFLKITAIDRSLVQIEAAKAWLAKDLRARRLALKACDAGSLPFKDASFDAAFACWFFEHTPEPLPILKELARVLKPGGVFQGCEVHNASFKIRPFGKAINGYWEAFNSLQKKLGGDPDRGLKMKALLEKAGFKKVKSKAAVVFCDSRRPLRLSALVKYWRDLMLSALPALLEHGLVDQALADLAMAELTAVAGDPDGMFHFAPTRTIAIK